MQQHHAKGIVALSCLVIVGVIASLIFSSLSSNVNGNGGQPTPRSYLPNVSSADSPSATAALEILPNSSTYVDNQGQLHIVGEVHNWAGDSWDLTMQANVMDASTRVIDHGNGGLNTLNLLSNAVGCFDIILPIAPPGWATYTLSVSQSARSFYIYSPLDTIKVSAQSTSSSEYRVVGKVQNKLGVAADQVKVYSTLYDNKGNVIACSMGTSNSTVLLDASTTYFITRFKDASYGNVASVSHRAYGISWPATTTPGATSTASLPLVGSQGVLHINQNPVPQNGSVTAYWNVSNIQGIWFDKGDGSGFQSAAGSQSVTINGITSQRILQLKWRNSSGVDTTDTITVYISGLPAYPTSTSVTRSCSSSDPNWRGGSSNYPFCVAQDLEWTNGSSNPWYVSYNKDQTVGVKWDVYGISGLWLKVEGNGDKCGPAGSTGTFSVAINGSGTYYWNANTMGYGGYVVHLYVLRNDGVYVYHNEKYLCVGFDGSGPTSTTGPTATNTNTPLSTVTPIPIPTLAP